MKSITIASTMGPGIPVDTLKTRSLLEEKAVAASAVAAEPADRA